jgi:hypothetical protein
LLWTLSTIHCSPNYELHTSNQTAHGHTAEQPGYAHVSHFAVVTCNSCAATSFHCIAGSGAAQQSCSSTLARRPSNCQSNCSYGSCTARAGIVAPLPYTQPSSGGTCVMHEVYCKRIKYRIMSTTMITSVAGESEGKQPVFQGGAVRKCNYKLV